MGYDNNSHVKDGWRYRHIYGLQIGMFGGVLNVFIRPIVGCSSTAQPELNYLKPVQCLHRPNCVEDKSLRVWSCLVQWNTLRGVFHFWYKFFWDLLEIYSWSLKLNVPRAIRSLTPFNQWTSYGFIAYNGNVATRVDLGRPHYLYQN